MGSVTTYLKTTHLNYVFCLIQKPWETVAAPHSFCLEFDGQKLASKYLNMVWNIIELLSEPNKTPRTISHQKFSIIFQFCFRMLKNGTKSLKIGDYCRISMVKFILQPFSNQFLRSRDSNWPTRGT